MDYQNDYSSDREIILPKRAFWVLILIVAFIICLIILNLVVSLSEEAVQPAAKTVEHLLENKPPVAAGAERLPEWLKLLVAVFTILQILPLLSAAREAQKRPLSKKDVRRINFLCETPMYLGLLGSLVGVCLTQYTTGSTAAPLAYLTTISGILFFLFSKLTIWLSLPEEAYEVDEN